MEIGRCWRYGFFNTLLSQKSKATVLSLFLILQSTLVQGQGNAAEMLSKASRLGDLDRTEALVSAGVDPNLPIEPGRTPLYYASLYNRNEVAAFLLAHGADPNTQAKAQRSRIEFPESPLQIAASMGNLRMASMLTDAGAQVNRKAETGRTALQFAVAAGHLDMVRFLIEKGAVVNTRDAEGASPLDDAVWRGYLELTAILLAKGAGLNETETNTGATPINEAAFRGKREILSYLLQFHPNLEIADKRGYTPLENAMRMGNSDAALLLLEVQGQELETPEFLTKALNAALKKDESAVVAALLRRGAKANDALASGVTPLGAAVSDGASKSVRVLLNAGADPNRSGQDGTSALEDASLKGFYSIAEMLLDSGASVNRVNDDSGRTALYVAASYGRADVVSLLLRRGADPNLCGEGKESPYKTAVENGYSEVAAEIQHRGGLSTCKPQPNPVR